jgi:hypothetical protein
MDRIKNNEEKVGERKMINEDFQRGYIAGFYAALVRIERATKSIENELTDLRRDYHYPKDGDEKV